ncbi:hypothetical protein [Novosphingobium sp.]|uniref:hypothetical protein n=1 Tax=Novosphingobium sp. TaxID=1874826 RepID=UPI001D8DF386|nr:hypothetical protein [Novosphingobium sp.]MBX9663190.1 hypothetical protein [Novosphingobium sp.]
MALGTSVLWHNKDKQASFGKVRLKHRELFLDKAAQQASMDTLEKAYTTVRTTIGWMVHRNATKLEQAMQQYFKSGTGKAGDVQAILEITINGMNNGKLALKTDNTSDYRSINYFGDKKEVLPYIEGYVRNGPNGTKGDIHVKRDYIMNNRFQAVRTFIHEATHRFASTEDFGEQGYMWSDGSDFREPGITADQCLRNADSYAYFCMAMGYR